MYINLRNISCKRTVKNIKPRMMGNLAMSLGFVFTLFLGVNPVMLSAEMGFPFLSDVRMARESSNHYFNASAFLEEECGDGLDNDNDGDVDCADLDCGPEINSLSSTAPSACGAFDGSISISVVGGLPPYRFSVNNGLSWQTNGGNYTNLANNTYIIRVQNADESCTANYPDVDLYNADSPIMDSVIVTNPTLCFLNDGTLNIYARGENLEYSINGGNTFSTQSSYTGLNAGVYRVRVKKGECIVSHQNEFVIEPDCASNIVIPTGSPIERCEWRIGENITLDLEGSPNSGTELKYVLTDPQGLIIDVSSTTTLTAQTDANIFIAFILGVENGTTSSGLSVGNYIQSVEIQSLCYVWSAGYLLEVCPSTESSCTDGIDNDGDGMTDCDDDDCSPIVMTISGQDPTDCNLDNGNIIVTAAGGQTSSYLYSIDMGQTWQSSAAFGSLGGGVYQVMVANSDETCPRISPDVILQNPLPPTILNILSGNSTSCEQPNGNITILATGSMAVLYSIDGGQTYQESGQFTGLSGDTYEIKIKNENGSCEISQDNVVLQDPVQPNISNVNTQNPSACGMSNGFITISASGNSTEFSINGGNTYQTSNLFENLGEGSFNISVRNQDGSCRVLYNQNPVLLSSGSLVDITNVDVQHANSCEGTTGMITISATGGSSFLYSINGGNTTQSFNIFTNVSGGNYDIVVSNSDGSCPEEYPTIIVLNESSGTIVSVDAFNPSDCGLSNGSITIQANQGTSNLEYRINNGSWQSSNNFNNILAGTYSTSIRNVGGNCEVNGPSATVTDPVAPTFTSLDFTHDDRCDSDNGTITIMASGTGNLEYSIDGGQSWSFSGAFTDLGEDNYPTAIRNADGSCMVTNETVTITENTSDVSVSLSKTDITCFDENDGTINPTIQGGVEPYEYSWNNSSGSSSLSGLNAGTYTLIVTDAKGCAGSAEIIITSPLLLVAGATAQDDEQCNNCLNITASGGTSPYVYSADGESYQESNVISGVRGGMYTISVRDANGCIATAEVELVDNNPLSCFIEVANTMSCNGESDGSVVINPDAGEAPFLYSGQNMIFTTNNTFSELGAGEHVFFITDNTGNSSSCSVTLENPMQIIISSVQMQLESCFEYGDAIVTVEAQGGTGSLEYSLNGNGFQSSSVINDVIAGTYNLTVRDDNGCVKTESITIQSAPQLNCSITNVQPISCNGNTDGGFTVQGDGGDGPFTYSLNGSSNNTGTFSGLSSGMYLVQVIDSKGCINTCTAVIEEPDQLACSISSMSNVTCAGEQDGSVTIGIEGGTAPITYKLENEINTTGVFNNLRGGTYLITATDASGCISICEVDINENSSISANIMSSSDVTCFGENDGSFTAFVSGGSGVYSYFIDGSQRNSSIITNLGPGTYTFMVSDNSGCTAEDQVTITEPNELSCTSSVLAHVQCFGDSDGSARINALGGKGTRIFTVNGTSNLTGVFNNLSAGTYTATVRDANGCQSLCDFEISQPVSLACSIENKKNISCEGAADGSFAIVPVGGLAPFTYSLDGITFVSSNIFSGLDKGFYFVDIKDANGCTSSCSVTIEEPIALQCVINDFVDVNCSNEANGRIEVSGNGGTSPYLYSLNNGGFGVSGIFENLSAGSYDVRVQDANGCISVCDLQVSQPSDLTCNITDVTNTSCAGEGDGSITVEAMGGSGPYAYSVDGIMFQQNPTISGLSAGTFTISIRDAVNCVTTCQEVNIIAGGNLICEVETTMPATCGNENGGSVTLVTDNGTAPYEYSIDGENYQSSNTIDGLSAGTFTITSRDATGCTTTCEVVIEMTENQLPTIECAQSVVDLGCNPEVIPDGNALILLEMISVFDADGTAVPEVIDESVNSEGCNFTSTIRFRAMDNCGQVSSVETSCAIEIKWTMTNSVTAVCPENLILTCGDVNNPQLINEWLTTISAEDVCSGEATFSNSFTENGFTQTCSEGTGNQIVTFTVEDECGNSATCTATIEIKDMDLPELSNRPADINVSSESEIPEVPEITATDNCSEADVTYLEETTTGNCGYTLERTWTATDLCGNSISHTQRINVSESLVASISLDSDIVCAGDLGTASVTIIEGNAPYTYTWSNGGSASSLDNLVSGAHSVTITDNLACSVILGVNIAVVEAFVVDINIDAPIACDKFQLATISLSIQGGSPDLNIEWSDGSSDIIREELDMGTYSVTVTDANGCTATDEVILEETGTCTSVIGGLVWEDLNRDGVRDQDDPRLNNMLVMIFTANEQFMDSTRSNADGVYSFSSLPKGDFFLKTEPLNGYRITLDLAEGDNAFNNSTSTTDILSIETGEILESIGLGLYRLGKISGIVWNDFNQNGIFNDNEGTLQEIQVKLLNSNEELLASTFSDSDGKYSFNNLPPGKYFVEFNNIESLNGSPVGQGDDLAKQSYADPMTGRTDVIEVNSGDCYESVNAGFFGVFDLELTLSSSTEIPQANELVAFSIMIKNKGNIDANNVSVKTEFGNGLQNPIAISNDGILNENIITWSGLNIPAGGEMFVAYRVEAMPFMAGNSYMTRAEIFAAEIDDIDSTPGNGNEELGEDDEASIITAPEVTSSADLSLTMTSNSQVVIPGGTIQYILTLKNNGPETGSGVEITNYLAAGFVKNITDISEGGIMVDNEILWMIEEIEVGASIDLSFSADVLDNIGREDVRNGAEITEASQFDPNSVPGNMGDFPMENDEALHIASVNKTADLELNIKDNESLYEIGEMVTFDIKVINRGLDEAAMVKVVNYVPPGIVNITNINNGGTLVGNEIHWLIYDLNMNENMLFNFTGELIPTISICDPYLNKAEILTSSAADDDSTPGNMMMIGEDDDDALDVGIAVTNCINVDAKVFLEGAFMKAEDKMHNILYQNGYLPGQIPQTFFGNREQSGQPYHNAPWNHCGDEGETFDANNEGVDDLAGYPDNSVDWVLVSLRTDPSPGSAVCRKAALVLDDGEIYFVEEFDCCGIDDDVEYYMVIEHRNHLPIMSPSKMPIVEGKVSFDFTNSNSFVALLGTGQKEITPGRWVMIAGNGQQDDFIESGDINVNDLSKWSREEGDNSGYYFSDFDLNGDVNVQDKGLVLRNFGVFSDVMNR